MDKRIRWIIGLSSLVIIFLLILVYPISSILGWQSNFLMRCFFVLLLCSFFCLVRIGFGPTAADRAVAIDILGILIVGFCAILGIATGRNWYIDIGIAWALQSFIATIALAKYLEGRGFDD